MFEAYKIGVALTIDNKISPVVFQLAEDFKKLQKLSESANRSFNNISKQAAGINKLAMSVQNLNNQLSKTVKEAQRAGAAIGGMGAYGFAAGGSGAAGFAGMGAAMGAAAAVNRSMPVYWQARGYERGAVGGDWTPGVTNLPGIYRGRMRPNDYIDGDFTREGGISGGGVPGRPPNQGFRMPPVLPIMRGAAGAVGAAGGLVGRALNTPLPGMITGIAVAGMGKHAIHNSVEYDQESTKLKLYGMDAITNAKAMKFADTLSIPGVDKIQALRLFGEAQGIFRQSGDDPEKALNAAKMATPLLAKVYAATAALGSEGQAQSEAKFLSMLRFIEMSGGLASPKRFEELADLGWKMSMTSGGAVDFEQLRQFKARAMNSSFTITDEALAGLEPIIGMLKGSTAGFAARTSYNRTNGIVKLPNQTAHFLVDNGIWDKSKVIFNDNGGIKAFKGNPFTHSKQMAENPEKFYSNDIMPIYKKLGITDLSEIGRQNSLIFGSTGGGLYTLIHKNMDVITESLKAYNQALGINASFMATQASKQGKLNVVTQKYSDLFTELGDEIFPAVEVGLNALLVLFRGLVEVMNMGNYIRESSPITMAKVVNPLIDSVMDSFVNPLPTVSDLKDFGNILGGSKSDINKINPIAPKNNKPVYVQSHVNLDKRKVGSVMFGDAIKPPNGTSWFDSGINAPPVAMPVGR